MEALSLDQIRPLGMLGARCSLSAARLEGPDYRPDAIFTADQAGWPGDWEGRAILGQCLICRVTGKTPSYLEEILRALPTRLNARGYLGPILPAGEFDEQQLSGHSWLLRGLCEAYEWMGDPQLLTLIRQIMEALFLPARAAYDHYPLDNRGHVTAGAEAGQVATRSGCWHISTDTGCAFIPLDGVSHAYRILRDPAIAELLKGMINRYLQLDFTGLMVQTHATLTGCRGLLRFAQDTGDTRLLQQARRIFDLYCHEGMTAHYANYNWFGRPQWTEPCAVIDSYMLAMQLYQATGCTQYQQIARLIGFNGLFHGQRSNGGFGTDSCPGPEGGSGGQLAMSLYEAPWCCTMRGGEGLARMTQYSVLVEGNRAVFTQLLSCQGRAQLANGNLEFKLISQYPNEGQLSLSVICCPSDCEIDLALPAWASPVTVNGTPVELEGGFVRLSPNPGEQYEIGFSIPLRRQAVPGLHNGQGHLLLHGELILGADACPEGEPKPLGGGCYQAGPARLSPIADAWSLSKEQLAAQTVQVIFP